jgi:hypothetical protein
MKRSIMLSTGEDISGMRDDLRMYFAFSMFSAESSLTRWRLCSK